jgi:modulator of FtsH protease HflC
MNQYRTIGVVVAIAVVIIIALMSVFTVHQREQALVLRLGQPVRVISEPGLQFRIPFFEEVVKIDRRVLYAEGSGEEVPTRDQKQLIIDYFARYRVTNPLLFFQTVRSEEIMQQRLLPIITSQLRRVVGGVPMAQLLTAQRADMMLEITRVASQETERFGIQLIDVRMKRVDLPTQNSLAVFNRMKKQREAEAGRIRTEGERDARRIRAETDKEAVVAIAEARRQASILRGEGEAEATRLYNEAYGKDAQFFDFFRSLQAMETGMPASTTTYVGPAKGDFFRFFDQEEGAPGTLGPEATSPGTQ